MELEGLDDGCEGKNAFRVGASSGLDRDLNLKDISTIKKKKALEIIYLKNKSACHVQGTIRGTKNT